MFNTPNTETKPKHELGQVEMSRENVKTDSREIEHHHIPLNKICEYRNGSYLRPMVIRTTHCISRWVVPSD